MVWESIRQNTNIHQYSTTNDGLIFTNIHQYLPSFIIFYLSCFMGKSCACNFDCFMTQPFPHTKSIFASHSTRETSWFRQGHFTIQTSSNQHENQPFQPFVMGFHQDGIFTKNCSIAFKSKMIHPGVNEHSHGNYDYRGGFPTIHVNSSASLGGAVPVISRYGCIYIYINYNVIWYNQW